MAGSERQTGINSGYYAEIVAMTFGNYRIIWTDGFTVDNGW